MFWSIEVEHGSYQYISTEVPEHESLPDDSFFTMKPTTTNLAQPEPSFWHNPLHDCESLWWMLLWSFAMRIPSEPDSEWNSGAQVVQLNIAFSRHFCTADRRLALFWRGATLARVFRSFEINLQQAFGIVNYIRGILNTAFNLAEARLPDGEIDGSVWEYEKKLHIILKHATERLKAYEWPTVENWSPENLKAKKHRRSTSE
jgi:hypothetical protein